MTDFNFAYTDERGVEHFYPKLFGWHCNIHNQVCDPFKRVTEAELLDRAAKDPSLNDGAFVGVARAVEDRLPKEEQ